MELDGSTRIYGWSLADIRKVQRWMDRENIAIMDLECGSFRHHYWERMRIADAMSEGTL